MNRLFYGDNLQVLREHIATESVDLIYLDPPFNSNRSYNVLFRTKRGADAQAQIGAFDDTWTWSQQAEAQYDELVQGGAPPKVADAIEAMRRLLGDNDVLAYLVMMTARLVELHRVLKPTGSLYLHCDPTAPHYLKIMLDAIFGPTNFRNEITWQRFGSHNDARRYGRVADRILFYTKSEKYAFNVVRVGYSKDHLNKRFKNMDSDGRRYWPNTCLAPGGRGPKYEWNGHVRHWRFTRENMQKLHDEGQLHYTPKGMPYRKNYLDELKGQAVQDLWVDVQMTKSGSERLGYPTQKPLALLERIIAASSNPGDVILDPFCGCGTTVDAAQKLGRSWIGADISTLAVDLIRKRLQDTYGPEIAGTYEVHGLPRDIDGARELFLTNAFDFERWAVGLVDAQANEKQVGDKGIDGVIRFPLDTKAVGRAIVSVKGGATLTPAMVRDLRGTIETQKAELGIFICLTEPTRGMIEEANKSGSYVHDLTGTSYPRVQLITIKELLDGVRPAMPSHFLPYVQAKRLVEDNQIGLFDSN